MKKIKKIALIAPSGRVSNEKINKAIANVKVLGCEPVFLRSIENFGYLAGTDQERLEELQSAFERKDIDAIFCIRGGYGATRLLDNIDYHVIRQNPKIFAGYSDITALQAAFFVKANLPTIHGFVASGNFTPYIKTQIQNLIFFNKIGYELKHRDFNVVVEGVASGKIVGGNLSLLVSLIGTPFQYKFANNLVFIEEIAEPPYKIDRMLVHILQSTDLKDASAIIFGVFNKCTPEDFNIPQENTFTIPEIIKNNFSDFTVPVIYNLNFGHIEDSLIFPVGLSATLDTKSKKIVIQEKFEF